VAPTGVDLLAWVTREIAGRVVERAAGDLKEASGVLNLPADALRKILAGTF
jgi:hypothetical protein